MTGMLDENCQQGARRIPILRKDAPEFRLFRPFSDRGRLSW